MVWHTSLVMSFFSLIISLKMIVLPPIIMQAYHRLDSHIASSYLISDVSPLALEIPVVSTSTPENQSSKNNLVENVFKPPKDDAPDDTRGAGSRDTGHCPADQPIENQTGFQVLMPVYTEITADRPKFLVYVPETTATKLFFSLKDASENYYYETTILIPSTGGKFSFELPSDAPVIEPEKEYTWSFFLICDRTFDSNTPIAKGVIRKVNLN